MEIIKRKTSSIKRGVKDIHTKKPYLELIAAALTIPVLITVFALNIDNLKGDKEAKAEENNKTQTIVITQPSGNQDVNEKEVIVTKEACEPGIGDVSISFPEEGETITDNPVLVDIDYDAGDYCAVVWSYRVNGGTWSSYDDTSISLYNLSNGNVKLDLRVKSVVEDSDNESLSRNFVYNGGATNTPTTSPTLTPTPTQ